MKPRKLPVVVDCDGCGVCCMHMGYPAFMLPRKPITKTQIESDPDCKKLLKQGWTEEELLQGFTGEKYWTALPDDLRAEWVQFVDRYVKSDDLDGPCFWLDQNTRQCKNHEYRPQVCRDFEIGSKECVEWRTHYRSQISNSDAQ